MEKAKGVCHNKIATRPILYSDTINGQEAHRDDLWAVTTEELNAIATLERNLEILLLEGSNESMNKQHWAGWLEMIINQHKGK